MKELKGLYIRVVLPIKIGELTLSVGDGQFSGQHGIVLDWMASSHGVAADQAVIMKVFGSAYDLIHGLFLELTRPLHKNNGASRSEHVMKFTNSFFNAEGPPIQSYVVPTCLVPRVGYAFAEYTAARRAINEAYSQPNWDGDGALPIREETTKEDALAVLNQLEIATCAPEITPNPNGTLSFEWETKKGFGQLEIGRTRYSLCVQPRTVPHFGQWRRERHGYFCWLGG